MICLHQQLSTWWREGRSVLECKRKTRSASGKAMITMQFRWIKWHSGYPNDRVNINTENYQYWRKDLARNAYVPASDEGANGSLNLSGQIFEMELEMEDAEKMKHMLDLV